MNWNKLGIDLAKKKFDATLLAEEGQMKHREFDNSPAGYVALQGWLEKHQVTELHACMEATNIYWENLAQYLTEQGYAVSVVNPAKIKGFGQSRLQRNKTDKADSEVIALYCAQCQPDLWQAPSPAQRQLRAWSRHREALLKARTQQLNRLDSCRDEVVRASLQSLLEHLAEQIKTLEAQIDDLITQNPTLQAAYCLLLSIKGFGWATVIKLLAEFYDLGSYTSAKAAAADAGVTPAHHESGSSVRKRVKMSKVGKASVRSALYWPAISAIQHNPLVKPLVTRLEAKGKDKKVIRGAVMRKLLHIAYGVLKNQTPFDPNYVF